MTLAQLKVHHVRNLVTLDITPHARYNIIAGVNGSGKTSLLEAIYLLSRGFSFRTRETAPLVNHDQSLLTVFARTAVNDTISIQKKRNGSTQVKVNHQACQRASELAHFLPCHVFYSDIFQIIDAGPAVRRSMLDWGLFHVKPAYYELWKDYAGVLKHRNALLRQKAAKEQFVPWNKQLVALSYDLHAMRAAYIQEWSVLFQAILAQLTATPCHVEYYRGWDRKNEGHSLADILSEQFPRDCQQQYTHSGAHQADLILDSAALKAKQVLSRGQQKIILIALKLAQAQLVQKPCIYLFDDVMAELDQQHLARFFSCIEQIHGQFFMTVIEPNQLMSFIPDASSNLFVIEQGYICESNKRD